MGATQHAMHKAQQSNAGCYAELQAKKYAQAIASRALLLMQ